MRSFIVAASRFDRYIDKSIIRCMNYGLHQFSDQEKASENSRVKNEKLQKIKDSTFVRSINNESSPFDDEVKALEKSQVIKQMSKNNQRNLSTIIAANKYQSKKGTMFGTYMRVINEETAQKFVDLIMSKPAKNAAYVAEINPSFGLITTRLLDAGISKIHLFEPLPHFYPILNSVSEKYPDRINLKTIVFDHLWRMGYLDWMNKANYLPTFLEGLDQRKWSDDSTFHIIGAIANTTLIARYMIAIIFQNSFTKFGRVIFHIAMPPSIWNKLSADNTNWIKYSSLTILFQTLFDYELLGTLPRAGFFPKYKKRLGHIRSLKHYRHDKTLMCVVRIEARKDLYENILTESDVIPFFYFIKHHLKKRSSKIIPELEKWVPDCGRDLIAAGINVTTEFGELLPPELVKLFLLFKSWPGYKQSSFVSMVDVFEKTYDDKILFGTSAEKIDEMFKLSKASTNAQAQSTELNDKSKSTG